MKLLGICDDGTVVVPIVESTEVCMNATNSGGRSGAFRVVLLRRRREHTRSEVESVVANLEGLCTVKLMFA